MDKKDKPNKIDAIYNLRDAVEQKVNAEKELEARPSAETRDALLDAQLVVEAKTQDAIEACLECGTCHGSEEPHRGLVERDGNVLGVNFNDAPERNS
jgi:hypothetical protein